MEPNQLELDEGQIRYMLDQANIGMPGRVPLVIFSSDSYGPHLHRTWVFKSECGRTFGSIERYWGGLKMICTILGQAPRTSFFTERGIKTTNKGLKSALQTVE
jgi:hypothetical protein